VGPSNLDVGTKNFNDGVGTPNFEGVRTQKFDDGVETPKFDGVRTPKLGVSTTTTTTTTPAIKRRANIAIIVNQYKRICTINIRKTDTKFAWQSRFYDHIIRDYEELQRIRHYIRNNPKKWHKDDQRGDAQI
jgi:hypothetical protein